MLKFMKGVMKLPLIWQIWVAIMIVVNAIAPFFFLSENIAIITIISVIVGTLVAIVLVEVQGFTKLLGLMHAPWVPMLAAQIVALCKNEPQGNFRIWLLSSIAITSISLVLDVVDIVFYLKGNTKNLLKEN